MPVEAPYSGGENERIVTWNAAPSNDNLLPDHPAFFSSVDYSPDSKVLAAGCADRSVTLWDARTEQMLFRIGDDDQATNNMQSDLRKFLEFFAFGDDSKRIADTHSSVEPVKLPGDWH